VDREGHANFALLTRIATAESVSLCVRMKSWRRFWKQSLPAIITTLDTVAVFLRTNYLPERLTSR
jgi:hypothetical protein